MKNTSLSVPSGEGNTQKDHALDEADIAHGHLEPGRIIVSACQRSWVLHRPQNLETLWEAMGEEDFSEDERLPYWVELWPASLALASWLLQSKERIQGKVCLDLGCGLGFTAIVASWLGARVIGIDYESAALGYAKKNASVNAVSSPLWVTMDWRFPAVQRGSCTFIWGGDIMYERRFVLPVLDFMAHALADGGVVWVAEPDRTVYSLFRQTLETMGWASRRVVHEMVEPLHIQKSRVPVNLWEITRKTGA